MEENTNGMSRSKRMQKGGKKKRKGCLKVLGVILFIVLGIFLYAYFELRQTTDTIYSDVDKDRITHSSRENKKVDLNGDAFSILFLGIDTGDMGRMEQGRSDTIMVMTVNPETENSTLVSIPRDTYTEIIGR